MYTRAVKFLSALILCYFWVTPSPVCVFLKNVYVQLNEKVWVLTIV